MENFEKSPVYKSKARCKFVNLNSLHFGQNLSKQKIDKKRRKLEKVQDNLLELDKRRRKSLDRSLTGVKQDDRLGLNTVSRDNYSDTSLGDVNQDYYLRLDKRGRNSSETRLKDRKHDDGPEIDRKKRKSLERKLRHMRQEDRLGINGRQKSSEKRFRDLKQDDRLKLERRRKSSDISFGNSNEDDSFSSLILQQGSSKKSDAVEQPGGSKDEKIIAGLNHESNDSDQAGGSKDTGDEVEKKKESCAKTYIPVVLEFVTNALILIVIMVFISENFL